MPDTLTISGIEPYDGEYEFDIIELTQSLNGNELHFIKQRSGVRAGELIESLSAGDYDVALALSTLVLQRRGKRVDPDRLWDASIGAVKMTVYDRDAEEQTVPPAEAPETPTEQPPTSGGESGSQSSEQHQENGQSRTGLHALAKSAVSDRVTSEI